MVQTKSHSPIQRAQDVGTAHYWRKPVETDAPGRPTMRSRTQVWCLCGRDGQESLLLQLCPWDIERSHSRSRLTVGRLEHTQLISALMFKTHRKSMNIASRLKPQELHWTDAVSAAEDLGRKLRRGIPGLTGRNKGSIKTTKDKDVLDYRLGSPSNWRIYDGVTVWLWTQVCRFGDGFHMFWNRVFVSFARPLQFRASADAGLGAQNIGQTGRVQQLQRSWNFSGIVNHERPPFWVEVAQQVEVGHCETRRSP